MAAEVKRMPYTCIAYVSLTGIVDATSDIQGTSSPVNKQVLCDHVFTPDLATNILKHWAYAIPCPLQER